MHTMTKYGLYFDYPAALPPDTGEHALHEQATALSAVCDRWEAEQQQVMGDTQLSGDARKERLAELTHTHTAAVERALGGRFGSVTRAALQADIEQTRAALALRFHTPTGTDTDRLLAGMDERGVLDKLRAMTPGARYAKLCEAAQKNDLATLRAARNTRLVTPEQWARVNQLNLQRHYAERADTLARLEKLAEAFDENARIARATVRGQGRRRLGVAR